MLDTMRKISGGIFAKLLMLLLVISFGVWGVGDILKSSGTNAVAKVGGESITPGELQQATQRVVRQMQAQGVELDTQKVQMLVLRQLVQQKLITQTVAESGLHVGDSAAARILANDPKFKNLDGKFSDTAFRDYVRNQGVTESSFLQQLKQQLGGEFLLASMSAKDVTVPEAVGGLAARAASETRDVVLISIPAVAEAPDDAAIEGYYNENKEMLFMAPERRTLEYVSPQVADVQALIDKSITPEMLAERQKTDSKLSRDQLLGQLRSEQRDAVMRDLANNIEDALAGGASMADAVAKAGLKAETKTLSNITREQYAASTDKLAKVVADQGFQLSEGETSNLLTTPDGRYALVNVKAITPATPKPLAEVKAQVVAKVRVAQARSKALAQVGKVKDELAKGSDWKAALTNLKLQGREINGITKDSGALPAPLAAAAFEQPVGKTAGPLSDANGNQQLAYVVASHFTAAQPTAAQRAKAAAQLTGKLDQNIQAEALAHMSRSHKVKVNEAAFRKAEANE